MRPYGDLESDAEDRPPFSNGTEWYAWFDNWCGTCLHDAPARRGGDGDGCPLVLLALTGKTPVEFLDQRVPDQPSRLGDQFHCIEYRPEDDDGDGHEPEDPLPGQGELVPRDPYERPKMFADVVATIRLPNR